MDGGRVLVCGINLNPRQIEIHFRRQQMGRDICEKANGAVSAYRRCSRRRFNRRHQNQTAKQKFEAIQTKCPAAFQLQGYLHAGSLAILEPLASFFGTI